MHIEHLHGVENIWLISLIKNKIYKAHESKVIVVLRGDIAF